LGIEPGLWSNIMLANPLCSYETLVIRWRTEVDWVD